MTLRDRLNLIDGELAWTCEAVRVVNGRAIAVEPAVPYIDAIQPIAARLYLDTQPVDDTLALIHRGGWPFDLKTFEGEPIGAGVLSLRPRGAGDEVMRELIESFEARHATRTLLIRNF